MEPLVVVPTKGLCNRLRVVFSYLMQATSEGRPLVVIWKPSAECNGFFLDYFKPLPNTRFLTRNTRPRLPVAYEGYEWHPSFSPYESFIYEDLCLTAAMERRVRALVSRLGGEDRFISLHIRRTDHTTLATTHGMLTPIEVFTRFIDSHPTKKAYLATDNHETQAMFLRHYGPRRLLTCAIIPVSDALRKTSLEDAVVDIFVASNAAYFMGSGYSSFTSLIEHLYTRRKRLMTEDRDTETIRELQSLDP